MEKKVFGVLLLIGGIVVAIFGFLYMNSIQYQAMSALNSLTGSRPDPTGTVAIIIGAILSVLGAALLITSSPSNTSSRPTASLEASRLLAEGERKINNKDYNGAIQTLEKMLDIQPFAPMANYYLGGLYALKKDKNRAFKHLSLAVEQGFKDFKAIDSEFLRNQPEFQEFVRNGYKLPQVKPSDDGDYITKLYLKRS